MGRDWVEMVVGGRYVVKEVGVEGYVRGWGE